MYLHNSDTVWLQRLQCWLPSEQDPYLDFCCSLSHLENIQELISVSSVAFLSSKHKNLRYLQPFFNFKIYLGQNHIYDLHPPSPKGYFNELGR